MISSLRVRYLASPTAFLMSMAFINWLGFASWQALLNNFAKDAAGFTGWEIGILQSVREIPGFLAFTAVFWFMLMREQVLAYISIAILAVGIAATGFFPSYQGLLLTTFVMSVGFHYFETATQALGLQLLPKADAPRAFGKVASAMAAAQLLAYSLIAGLAWLFAPSYRTLYIGFGIATVALLGLAMVSFKHFRGSVPQHKGIVLRQRYWLYYALTFLSGARRQLFMAFGGWLLVEKFGYDLTSFSILLFIYCGINLVTGPLFGQMIARIGERNSIIIENSALVLVFIGYATTSSAALAGSLFVLDGIFAVLVMAQRTYFQKITHPADIAPTASVAFTINHIAAIVIPVGFGGLWVVNPSYVFGIGAGIALCSLSLALLVPRHPEAGRETIFSGKGVLPLGEDAPGVAEAAASALAGGGVDDEPVKLRA